MSVAVVVDVFSFGSFAKPFVAFKGESSGRNFHCY